MRLIDADALIEKAIHYGETEYHFDHESVCVDDIDDAPTIHAPRWVRCDEPPEMDEITPVFFASDLILMYDADSESTYFGYARSNEKNGKISWIVDSAEVEVTHWMPLPEPPKDG